MYTEDQRTSYEDFLTLAVSSLGKNYQTELIPAKTFHNIIQKSLVCYGARASYIFMLRYVHFALFTMKVNSGMICLVLNKLFLYCCVGDGAVDGVHEQLRIENMLCIKITISN